MSGNEIQIQTAAFRLQVKKRSDKLINYFLAGYFIMGLAFAFFYDTWAIAIGSGALCLIAYYSAKKTLPDSNLYQYVLSVVLGVFMAQFIYQMHGMFEMHFFAFIGSAILITYQNWKLQIPITLVVVIHHLAFGLLQNAGVKEVYFSPLNNTDIIAFVIHFVLAAIIFFICGLWGYLLKKYCENQIRQSIEMVHLKEHANINQEMALLQENLEKEKYYLDSLMDNMPDSIYFKDKDSRVLRVSKYMANRFNCSMDQMIGKTDFDFQDRVHAQEAYNDEQDIQRTRIAKIDYIEKEIKNDGTESWITTTKMPLVNAKGEVVGTFGMSRDITKVKILEAERHSADLEKAVAQGKFEIASNVMHDIGNAVVGFGSYLTRIRRVQEQDKMDNLMSLTRFFEENKSAIATAIGDAKAGAIIKMLAGIALSQRSNQEEVAKSITEQLNIITHIQEILNIQRQYIAGKTSQGREPVNIRHVINDSISMVFASIDKMAIGVSLEMPQELPIIKGDRTKLMQAILNILKNSIEAIDKNAEEKTISLNAYTKQGQLVLQIRDSGAGFDKTTADQLFKRGFSTKFSGSGFGLYNCRSIIESHDGTIDIASEGPGKGSVTTMSFKLSA